MKWIVGSLLIFALAVIFNLGLLAFAMYALLGVMFVNRYLAKSWVENVAAVRACNRLAVNIGEKVAINIELKNRGRLPIAWLLVEDMLPRSALIFRPPNLSVQGKRMDAMMMKGNSVKSLYYQLQCNRRGYYQIGPMVMETGDLFGLHRRYRVLTQPHFLLVYPEVIPLEGYEISSKRPIGEVRMTHRLFEDPTRIAGVRRYETGDPLNRIHWPATARTGTLHCKVFEPSTVAGATILLDFHVHAYPAQHEPIRSDLAVTVAASLANAVFQMGQQVGFATNGRDAADRIRQEGWNYDIRSRKAAQKAASMADKSDRLRPVVVETRRGVSQLMRILETLARVELTDGLDFSQLIMETSSRLPRDATVIAILPEVDARTAMALGNLRRRGFAVEAIITLFEDDAFAAAAGKLLAEGVGSRQLKQRSGIATLCQNYLYAQ